MCLLRHCKLLRAVLQYECRPQHLRRSARERDSLDREMTSVVAHRLRTRMLVKNKTFVNTGVLAGRVHKSSVCHTATPHDTWCEQVRWQKHRLAQKNNNTFPKRDIIYCKQSRRRKSHAARSSLVVLRLWWGSDLFQQ